MPASSSYLAAIPMSRGRSFAYHKLKKLPPAPPAATLDQQDHQPPTPSAAAIQESYNTYYRALGAAVARGRRSQWQRQRRVRPRLRISRLARALRRKAAAVGGRVRASVAKVARRLKEGRPYIGDLFAGNYMFMQVAPSPTMVAGGLDDKGAFAPFTDYYYAKVAKSIKPPPPPPPVAGALQVHHAAAAAVLYKV